MQCLESVRCDSFFFCFIFQAFPNRQHCTDCYNNRLGSDLWSEFNHDKVIQFLTDLYSEDNLSMRGLRISSDKSHAGAHSQHEVAIYQESKSSHNEYLHDEKSFWGTMDISLCFSIYMLSAAILLFVYCKFIAKKNICFGFIYNTMFKHQQSKQKNNGLNNVV